MTGDAAVRDLTVGDRYDEDSIREFRARGYWRDGSLFEQLDHWADATPDQPYVSDGDNAYTYGEIRGAAYRFGAKLLELGVKPGDRVIVQLPNLAEFPVAYFGISRIGAVMVPIMMVYRYTEVAHVIRNSGAVAVVTTGTFRGFDHAGMFRELQKEIPALANIITVHEEPLEGETSFAAAIAGDTVPSADDLGPGADPDDPHVIVYTSGTESTAKGCVHTWNTINFSAHGLAHDVFEATQDDVIFMPSPVAHATGLLVGLLAPLAIGAGTHLMPVWEPADGLRRIEKYRCTVTATATPFVRMAIDASKNVDADVSSMRFWLCAGAPIPEALAAEFEGVFSGGRLMPLYGATEFLAATCCHLSDPVEKVSSSDGRPALEGVKIKLADPDTGQEVPQGQEGEICYWGPGAVLGYWRNPERTAATIDKDGWHHTGDLGKADADGYIRVSGRLKDIIIRGGTNLSAGEIEGHIMAHPDVAQVAVVAYPDDRLGEKACAVVVPAAGAGEITLEAITSFMKERRVSMQKLPERLVVVDSLPMTATGKVQKFKLREVAVNG